MSLNKHTCLLLGVQFLESDFDIISDKLYELDESDNVEIQWRRGEGSKYIYVGKLLAESEPYTDGIHADIKFGDIRDIREQLYTILNLNIPLNDIKIWFFDWWG